MIFRKRIHLVETGVERAIWQRVGALKPEPPCDLVKCLSYIKKVHGFRAVNFYGKVRE